MSQLHFTPKHAQIICQYWPVAIKAIQALLVTINLSCGAEQGVYPPLP